MVKRIFSMPLRASQGFIDSVFRLAQVPLSCPHYGCISRRTKDVDVSFKTKTKGSIQHLAIDATGLKVYGEREWKVKKHGTDGKRRVWRKLHLAVDTNTHEIIAAELSLSTVTDAEVLPNLLKQTRRSGYHERSLSETVMNCAKQLLGGRLTLRNYNVQVGETYAMLKALNKVTGLGVPKACRIG